MYGAIIGDIIGSRFEFDRGRKTRKFELFTNECDFTDDTIMTAAVAEALMDAGPDADEKTIKGAVIRSMKKWGQKYPNAGYGARFISWVLTDDPKPYGSYGNGSGMRVSSAGWLYDSIERTREVARWTAEVSHNHPEGVKGAESVAAAIYMARNGSSKDEIKAYIENEFGYDLSRTLEEIRPTYHHVEDCMHTMPEAFTCFLESESYEDCIRNVMFIGGDTDTLGAIAGAVAEAFWGLPIGIIIQAKDFIPDDVEKVVERFNGIVHPSLKDESDRFDDNKYIKMAVRRCREDRTPENLMTLIAVLQKRIGEDGEVIMPMIDVNGAMSSINLNELSIGDTFQVTEEVRLRMETVVDGDGNEWFPLFTSEEELNNAPSSTGVTINTPIREIIRNGMNSERVLGVAIDPFGKDRFSIPKEILKFILPEEGEE
ncbi:MAG: hypothetical protein E7386_02135 [Ruminococcaceae bacterium]|nr:hypothetical protein [Oscillospiraceae bacterium]